MSKMQGSSIAPERVSKINAGGDEKTASRFNIVPYVDAKNNEKQQSLLKSLANDSNITEQSEKNKSLDSNSSTVQAMPKDYLIFDGEHGIQNLNRQSYAAAYICQKTLNRPVIETSKRQISSELISTDDLVSKEELHKTAENIPIADEKLGVSETMFIINDGTHDKLLENESFGHEKHNNTVFSNTAITHITNSVVLTKAKSADNRVSGLSRSFSTEPAKVVLMKLPTAAQQAVGIIDSRIEIPITEAFNFSTESIKTKAVKTVSTDKRSVSPLRVQSNPLLNRSKSIPNAFKTLSPRSEKRTQSLNYTQQPKLGTVFHQITTSNKFEIPKSQGNSIETLPISEHTSTTCTSSNLLTEKIESRSSSSASASSLDEINKENNEVTFIELEDSFAEDVPEEINALTSKIINKKIDQEEKDSDRNLESDSKGKTSICMSTKTGLNTTTQNISTESHSQYLTNFHKSSTTARLQPIVFTKNKSEKTDNTDKSTKSLLCNEKNTTLAPSTSTDSSKQVSSSVSKLKFAQSNIRATLPSRFRDYNKVIDANASTARRLCRDSSIASALSMVSSFDMLNWKEDRIASARGTAMRFELNEFNLLQVHERGCPPRYRIHTPYERPIYERFTSTPTADQTDPLLYLCRKCKLYGPAVDFLAPEFCSADCLKRTLGKRCSRDVDFMDRNDIKRSRGSMTNSSSCKPISKTCKQVPIFRWSTYISNKRGTVAAPIDLFFNPFPTGPNPFLVGMKVEAIDPENCSLFCVCTIVQIQGYRLRLNFDGYSSVYDFWVNADSMDIFPPGWCEKTNRILQPPRSFEPYKFEWNTYLLKTNSISADKNFFTHLMSTSITNRNPFTVGMFLEADDLNDTGKLCVASVADVLDERIRVHFDGWDDCYDYWVDISSPYIHPCGWHDGRHQLLVPPEYSNTSFNWRDYIRECQGLAAPTDFFVPRDPIDYRPGMKLEVVDPRNPSLIRPASIIHRTRHRVKIHFDCWPPEYTFCLDDDSPDLHPIGWCDATGHELEPPPGFQQIPMVMPCETIGCRGLGNIDRTNGLTHANRECCPYILENWRAKPEKLPRVDGKDIVRKIKLESTTPSTLLKNIMRKGCHSVMNLENPKSSEKPTSLPHKQPRGRPRNCDRLIGAASALEVEQRKSESFSRRETLKVDFDKESINKSIKKKAYVAETQKSNSSSAASERSTVLLDEIAHIKIARSFLCDYGPRLKQNYVLWRQNADGDIALKVQRNPLLWSTVETCTFIDSVLSEFKSDSARFTVSSKFLKHDIDGTALLMLQQQDLTGTLQFKIGLAVKLCSIVLELRMLVVSEYGLNKSNVEEAYVELKNKNAKSEDFNIRPNHI